MNAGPVIPLAATPPAVRRTALPRARGPVSGILLEVLRCAPGMPVELPLLDPSPELLASGLAAAEPALASDILWGAAALLELDARWARHLLGAWERGASSLLAPRSLS